MKKERSTASKHRVATLAGKKRRSKMVVVAKKRAMRKRAEMVMEQPWHQQCRHRRWGGGA